MPVSPDLQVQCQLFGQALLFLSAAYGYALSEMLQDDLAAGWEGWEGRVNP